MSNAKGAVTPGTKALRAVRLDDTALDPVEHRLYRAGVGTLQHLVPIRNDLAFRVKGVGQGLSQPHTALHGQT